MKQTNPGRILMLSAVMTSTLGLAACSDSVSSTSSGGEHGPGMPDGGSIMIPGQTIPLEQQVQIHDTGAYLINVQNAATMTLVCQGSVKYSFDHQGGHQEMEPEHTDSGVCNNTSMTIPISSSGTMHFTMGQGADMKIELHG